MQTLSTRLKLFTFTVWFALAGSAVYWLLKLSSAPVAPPHTAVQKNQSTPSLDVARMAQILGALPEGQITSTVAAYASRLTLHGVVATVLGGGVALISVDQANPKPYRIGSEVVDGVRLAGVSKNSALVGSERIYLIGTQPPTPVAKAASSVNQPVINSQIAAPNLPAAAPAAAQPSLGTSVDPSKIPPEIAKAIAQAESHNEPNPLPPVSPGSRGGGAGGGGASGSGKLEYPNLILP